MAQNKISNRLVILDAHAIIHRAYHALPDFSNSAGEPTGALYGLSSMLIRIITELKPDYILAAYDLPEKTFRHETYEGYKAGRAKADDALVAQLISSRKIFQAFGIPILEAPGFEADDVIGTLVEQSKKSRRSGQKPEVGIPTEASGLNIIIASGDMDTLQLVDGKRVQVFTLKRGLTDTIIYDEEKVLERYGFPPSSIPDYKGLSGDPSDNIPGIRGIGEKTATILVKEFGTIEKMYKELKSPKSKVQSLNLTERIKNIIMEGEDDALFSKTLATIRRDAPVRLILGEKFGNHGTREKVEKLFSELEFKSLLSRIKNLFSDEATDEPNSQSQRQSQRQALLVNEPVNTRLFAETALLSWLLNSEHTSPTVETLLSYSKKNTLEEAREFFWGEIKKLPALQKVYEEIEEPIIESIREMSATGVLVDRKYLEDLADEYQKEISALEKKIWRSAGREFNIASPKQLSNILFNELGLAGKGGAKAFGGPSTRGSILEELVDDHPIVPLVLSYRELSKLLSTYIIALPKLLDSGNRLHAEFIQWGSTTGRFSSKNPNLQNIPIRGVEGRRVRNAFIATKGKTYLSFDYSQIELRVLAILSGDPGLLSIFKEGKDIHTAAASRIFGIPEREVTADMRRSAKTINFGIIYGMGVQALRKNLGTTLSEAKEFYERYFKEFPSVKNYMDSIKETARKDGFTETLFGRRRYFRDIRSRLPYLRAFAERMAGNAPLQGTAADIMKLAIRFAMEDLAKKKLKDSANLVLQIHDEIVFEVEKGKEKEVAKIVMAAMEEVLPRSYLKLQTVVPLSAKVEAGERFGELSIFVIN